MLITYLDFGINNPDHYKLLFNTRWDDNKYPHVKQAAMSIFKKVAFIISEAISVKSSDPRIPIETTAIIYAFIHGLVELHLAGHSDV